MDDLRRQWERQAPAVRYGGLAVAVLLVLLTLSQLLPVLVAGLGVGLVLAVLFVPYWAPTIVAFARRHPSRGGIAAVNLLLGWTFLGWIAALVWALSDRTHGGPSVVVHNTVTAAFPPAPPYVGEVRQGWQFTGQGWVPLPPAGVPTPRPPHAVAPPRQPGAPLDEPEQPRVVPPAL